MTFVTPLPRYTFDQVEEDTMPEPHEVVRDFQGQDLLHCSHCGRPLTQAEFFDLGLRLPEPGESRDEYCDAEVLDSVTHTACLAATRAG